MALGFLLLHPGLSRRPTWTATGETGAPYRPTTRPSAEAAGCPAAASDAAACNHALNGFEHSRTMTGVHNRFHWPVSGGCSGGGQAVPIHPLTLSALAMRAINTAPTTTAAIVCPSTPESAPDPAEPWSE